MKILFVNILFLTLCTTIGYAQNQDKSMDSSAIVTNSFWNNWFGQLGVDMWLQNPYGSSFKNVFPNGKTFGVNLALGKWITPQFGIRGIINWENGIVNKHHHWYDVVAGAGIGIGSAELTWWLSDKLFGKGSNVAVGSSGNTVDVVLNL